MKAALLADLAAGAVLCSFLVLVFTLNGALETRYRCYSKYLAAQLRGAGILWPAGPIVAMQVALGTAGVLLALCGWELALLMALSAAVIPQLAVRTCKRRRLVTLDSQIEGFVAAVARALVAAPSLAAALRSVADLAEQPLRGELLETLREAQLGIPLDQALRRLAARAPSRNLGLALLTLRIGRITGGNLPSVLGTTAETMRELSRLEGVLRTKTAEAKAQALVISVVPIPLIFVIQSVDPRFFEPLENSFLGHVLTGCAVALWIGAAWLARRILAVAL